MGQTASRLLLPMTLLPQPLVKSLSKIFYVQIYTAEVINDASPRLRHGSNLDNDLAQQILDRLDALQAGIDALQAGQDNIRLVMSNNEVYF